MVCSKHWIFSAKKNRVVCSKPGFFCQKIRMACSKPWIFSAKKFEWPAQNLHFSANDSNGMLKTLGVCTKFEWSAQNLDFSAKKIRMVCSKPWLPLHKKYSNGVLKTWIFLKNRMVCSKPWIFPKRKNEWSAQKPGLFNTKTRMVCSKPLVFSIKNRMVCS